jgi:hypothetical protein
VAAVVEEGAAAPESGSAAAAVGEEEAAAAEAEAAQESAAPAAYRSTVGVEAEAEGAAAPGSARAAEAEWSVDHHRRCCRHRNLRGRARSHWQTRATQDGANEYS